jgi:hypothetical protein
MIVDVLVEDCSPLRFLTTHVECFQFVARLFDKGAWELMDASYVGEEFLNGIFQCALEIRHPSLDRSDRKLQ